jgi:hypothetical protein
LIGETTASPPLPATLYLPLRIQKIGRDMNKIGRDMNKDGLKLKIVIRFYACPSQTIASWYENIDGTVYRVAYNSYGHRSIVWTSPNFKK